MEPFHIFLLIIGLSGRPVGVLEYTGSPVPNAPVVSYTTKTECDAFLPEAMRSVQEHLDNSDNPAIKGLLAVADGKCATNREMELPPEPAA